MPNVQIIEFIVDKQDFNSLPDSVKNWLPISGLFSNEINIIGKFFIVSSNIIATNQIEKGAINAQVFFHYKTLARKLYDACQISDKKYFATGLSRDIFPACTTRVASLWTF